MPDITFPALSIELYQRALTEIPSEQAVIDLSIPALRLRSLSSAVRFCLFIGGQQQFAKLRLVVETAREIWG